MHADGYADMNAFLDRNALAFADTRTHKDAGIQMQTLNCTPHIIALAFAHAYPCTLIHTHTYTYTHT